MSAALSDAEKCSCHEILGVTTDSSGVVHDGFGVQLTLTELDELRDIVDAKLTALTGAQLDRVRQCVVAWDTLGFKTAEIENGSAGSVNGLTSKPDNKRALIRERLIVYVQVSHMKDAILQRRGGSVQSQSCSVRIMR